MTIAPDDEFPPCINCGEEEGSCPDGRCRDCDIDFHFYRGTCIRCGKWNIRRDLALDRSGYCQCPEPVYPPVTGP